MNTKTRSNSILGFALIIAALALFSVVTSRVQASSIFDITYPIAELGGCEDRLACKAYCEDENNRSACEKFASNYGISSAPKNDKSEKMKQVKEDGGPGQCATGAEDPQASCKKYCDSTENIDECVAYGKSHGLLSGQQLVEAEKVSTALKRGVKLPEGCTSQSSCKETCENPPTIEQAKSCFAFGKEAGLLPDDFNEERAEKVFEAIQDGTSPFKSPKDFRKCENPENDEIMQKCMDFAVRSGMMDEKQAEIVKKTGGKGPGGCRGEKQCNAYCEENQEECFQFSKDNGLINPEQEEQMKRGAEQFKQGINNAPEAVRTCLTSIIGQDKLDAVTSGTAMMDRSLGEKMRTCFEQNRPVEDENRRFMGPPRKDNQEQNGQFSPLPEGEQGQFMKPPRDDDQEQNGQFGSQQKNEQGRFMGSPQRNNQKQQEFIYPESEREKFMSPSQYKRIMPANNDNVKPQDMRNRRPVEQGIFPQENGEQRNMNNYQKPMMFQPQDDQTSTGQSQMRPQSTEGSIPSPAAQQNIQPPSNVPSPSHPETSDPSASVWSAFRSLISI